MSQDTVDVACFGETMLLLVPDPPVGPNDAERFRREIGGAESNVAINLRRLGAVTSWHSAVGQDAFGGYIVSRIASEGVECVARRDPDRLTGLYVKEVRAESTTVRYYRSESAASYLTVDDAQKVFDSRPAIVHTTGITPALSEVNRETINWLFGSAPKGTSLSFDVNYRPSLHRDGSASMLLDLANRADIAFCGEDEAAALWGHRCPDEIRNVICGPTVLVVKQGGKGSTVYCPEGVQHQPAPQVDVVEPVGAGDAFAAGFLYRHLQGRPASDGLEQGSLLAGLVLGVHSDLPPIQPLTAE